jgi:hypothetical protein
MDDGNQGTVGQRLFVLRLIWAALLMGQIVFGAVVIFLVRQRDAAPEPQLHPMLFYLAAALLVGGLFVGTLIRAKLGVGMKLVDEQKINSYATGTIIFLALCEGPSLLALVAVLLTGVLAPTLLVPAAAIAIQLVNLPRRG